MVSTSPSTRKGWMGLNHVLKCSSSTFIRITSRQSFHTVPQLTSILSSEILKLGPPCAIKGDKDVKKEVIKTSDLAPDFKEKKLLSFFSA